MLNYCATIILAGLASGEDIMISGFGKFQVNEKAPRKGRNPATGKTMILKKKGLWLLSAVEDWGIKLIRIEIERLAGIFTKMLW